MKKFFFDLFPVICFFLVFRYAQNNPEWALTFAQNWLSGLVKDASIDIQQTPILLATLVTMVATLLQVIWLKLRGQKIEAMLWLTLVLVVVFGGATIWFHDDHFIKWKLTILYVCFALALTLGHLIWRKNGIQKLIGGQITLPDAAWASLLWMWVIFFAMMAGLNLWVAYQFDTATWVNFKLFGASGLTLVFVVTQGFYLARFMRHPK